MHSTGIAELSDSDPSTPAQWEISYRDLARPSVLVLSRYEGGSAIVIRMRDRTRCFRLPDEQSFIKAMHEAAMRVGVLIKAEKSNQNVEDYRKQVVEERKRLDFNDVPIAEFNATRISSTSPPETASSLPRILIITSHSLYERRPSDYEVSRRHAFSSVGALVRYSSDPQRCSILFHDGALPVHYRFAARDQFLASLLPLAEEFARRKIPVLAGMPSRAHGLGPVRPAVGFKPLVAPGDGAPIEILMPEEHLVSLKALVTCARDLVKDNESLRSSLRLSPGDEMRFRDRIREVVNVLPYQPLPTRIPNFSFRLRDRI